MSSARDLKIYQKHYDLMMYAMPIINRFPKNQRFILGQQIQNTMVDVAKLIVEANKRVVSSSFCKLCGSVSSWRAE